ncbi:MAG TPA: hypothetical protein VK568_16455 [Thermodesulfobacteriota bacterium]|jgi:hypothetical protein|nr:hypothetical protein [Thermodesulfobacteriota bacterium]
MSKFKIVGMIVLIAFAMSIVLVGDAVAAEKGKVTYRQVFNVTTIHTLKVPDVEGHAYTLFEAKGILFSEKWGPAVVSMIASFDLIKGLGTFQGYAHTTYPDGSTNTTRFEGKAISSGVGLTGTGVSEVTWTYVKGTGKFQGIQGRGTSKSYVLAPGQFYADAEGEYTLP